MLQTKYVFVTLEQSRAFCNDAVTVPVDFALHHTLEVL